MCWILLQSNNLFGIHVCEHLTVATANEQFIRAFFFLFFYSRLSPWLGVDPLSRRTSVKFQRGGEVVALAFLIRVADKGGEGEQGKG